MSIPYKYSVLYPNDSIQVTVFYITGCAHSFYVKNKNEVIMVETTPRIVYDAMGLYYKQGYDSMNGHAMLLQAEMDRKKKSAQKKMSASKTDFGHLAPGEMKKEHPLFKFPFEIEDVFYDVTGNHVTPRFMEDKDLRTRPPPCIFYLKRLNRVANSQRVRYHPTGIMPDNTRRRPDCEEPSEEEKNRRSTAIVAAAASTAASQQAKKAQEGQLSTQMETMRQILEQQQTLILRHNSEAQLHHQQAADMARIGNAPAPPNPAPPPTIM
jgi:hypothetical protein